MVGRRAAAVRPGVNGRTAGQQGVRQVKPMLSFGANGLNDA